MREKPIPNGALPGVSIHRGFPNPGADSTGRPLDLNTLLIANSASTYLMMIEGDDWSDVGIWSGDVAVIDRSLTPKATDLAVWWEGSTFAISTISKKDMNAVVWGVVTAVIHRYRKSFVHH
jgi:DNA polymerase V